MVNNVEMSLADIIKSQRAAKKKPGVAGKTLVVKPRPMVKKIKVTPPASVKSKGRVVAPVVQRQQRATVVQQRQVKQQQVQLMQQRSVKSAPKSQQYKQQSQVVMKPISQLSAVRNEGPGRILISNLDFGVTETDIRELFGELGALRKAMIHYDGTGRPVGSAQVVYNRKVDALKAIQQYHSVPLDGRPMEIYYISPEVAGLVAQIQKPVTAPKQMQVRQQVPQHLNAGEPKRVALKQNQKKWTPNTMSGSVVKAKFKVAGTVATNGVKGVKRVNATQVKRVGNVKTNAKTATNIRRNVTGSQRVKKPQITVEQLNAELDSYKMEPQTN